MKKSVLFMVLCLSAAMAMSQSKYSLKDSKIMFYSKAALEDIQAVNKSSIGLVDASTKDFVVKVAIKSFIFDKALMQEHFNENYMESDKFPTAVFKGKIEGNLDASKDGSYPVKMNGKLDVHGVVKDRIIPVTIVVKNGIITFNGEFKLALADHAIKIPKMVTQNIAEIVDVKVEGTLELYVKKP
jgi:hypothetical protein